MEENQGHLSSSEYGSDGGWENAEYFSAKISHLLNLYIKGKPEASIVLNLGSQGMWGAGGSQEKQVTSSSQGWTKPALKLPGCPVGGAGQGTNIQTGREGGLAAQGQRVWVANTASGSLLETVSLYQ